MELYVLDALLRRTELVDTYESLIWTERYAAWGDFELVIRSDRGTRLLFPTGTRLAMNKSQRVMVVETVENTTNNDGVAVLTIKGRSMEAELENRAAIQGFTGLEAAPKWVITATPSGVINHIFQKICVEGILSADDPIPFYVPGSLNPPGSIALPTETVTMEFEPDTVYGAIKKVADLYDIGFRLVRNGDTGQLYFEIYTGHNRTTLQTTNSPVVFSPELDNLSDTTELTSSAHAKTVAYVLSKNGARIVYPENVDSLTYSGFDRKVLVVKADDIDLPAGSALDAALEQRGREELAKHRPLIAFDGEIPQSGSYEYAVHYGLGDLVETRNSDGLATNMRVTEQIFVSDAEGERSYPTLTIDLIITPGSWYAWDASQVWADADEFWEDA